MKLNRFLNLICAAICFASFSEFAFAGAFDTVKENTTWATAESVTIKGTKFVISGEGKGSVIYNGKDPAKTSGLVGKSNLGDSTIELDFLTAKDASATLFLLGRYAINLPAKNNEWQHLSLKFRSVRFDEARNKIQSALLMEQKINGELVKKNSVFAGLSADSPLGWEEQMGVHIIVAKQGQFAIRNLEIFPADFSQVSMPTENGKETNEKELIDYVALGKDTFESVGCSVCHAIDADKTVSSTGPNLYGLFLANPRNREIVEGGENHHFTIKADTSYLHRSVRTPSEQLAIGEVGTKKGEVYPAIMPPFSKEVLSDKQIDAIGAYLATKNDLLNQGPRIKLVKQTGLQSYDPIADGLQILVDNKTRIQRGPMDGVSGRAIHVGLANSVNYSFDPRILSIAKIWQGGFLDMSGEWLGRGGKGLKPGFESREMDLGASHSLLSPLNESGRAVDFTFKDANFGDVKTILDSIASRQDHLDRLAQENAQFMGYELNSKEPDSAPTFKYRVGKNIVAVKTSISDKGETQIELSGEFKTAQSFAVNDAVLSQIKISGGKLENHNWILPKGKIKAILSAHLALTNNPWHASKSQFDNRQQPVKITPAKADLPAGYSVESYFPPKDNYGREQLFEALGIAQAEDGTVVVATRTAGVWRLVKGEWHLFAEGAFDSLGVVIEDKKGLKIVIGQKAELTRISDTNGDGLADTYQTLFDAHSYHGNYHAYMHGPVRGGDGAYYVNINLAHGIDGASYNGGGAYMGSTGGFSGWSFRVQPDGKFETWANGLRSPAGLGVSNDGRVWYADNQGEFMGTSKIFVMKKNGFYGHPASLVDLPGMTPSSPEITWEKVWEKREQPIVLVPYAKVANSPGNMAWDNSGGKFGPFAGQLMIGDQTQSNLMRVVTEKVDGVDQGVLIPFMQGLASGIMRPLFLPDGSLLLGQTGRGWQAKGGKVASLQRVIWDGHTIAPAIKNLSATAKGFDIELTQPIAATLSNENILKNVSVESWVYRDAANYGSDELGKAVETIQGFTLSADRKHIQVEFTELTHPVVHPQQTARVYHISLMNHGLFTDEAPKQLDAYYTLYKFAAGK